MHAHEHKAEKQGNRGGFARGLGGEHVPSCLQDAACRVVLAAQEDRAREQESGGREVMQTHTFSHSADNAARWHWAAKPTRRLLGAAIAISLCTSATIAGEAAYEAAQGSMPAAFKEPPSLKAKVESGVLVVQRWIECKCCCTQGLGIFDPTDRETSQGQEWFVSFGLFFVPTKECGDPAPALRATCEDSPQDPARKRRPAAI